MCQFWCAMIRPGGPCLNSVINQCKELKYAKNLPCCLCNCSRGDVISWVDISDCIALLDSNFYLLAPLHTVPTKSAITFKSSERSSGYDCSSQLNEIWGALHRGAFLQISIKLTMTVVTCANHVLTMGEMLLYYIFPHNTSGNVEQGLGINCYLL